jgi:hypothetical protein
LPQEKINRALNYVIVLIAIIYHLRQVDIPGFYTRSMQMKNEAGEIRHLLQTRYSDYTLINGEKSSSPMYALKFSTVFNLAKPHQLARMKELNPGEIYFWGMTIGKDVFEDWTGEIALDSIMSRNKKVILQGDRRNLYPHVIKKIEEDNGVRLINVYSGNLELLYVIQKDEPVNPSSVQ